MNALAFRAGLLSAAMLLFSAPASAVSQCGGETDTCPCGVYNFCLCDGTCGNCVWHGWHSACCHWDRALEWCTDARDWDNQARSRGYPMTMTASSNTIFVCENSPNCSIYGHVGWVVTAYVDGSFDSTEQNWGGPCGTLSKHRGAGFANSGFICNPATGCVPPQVDAATFVSETYPDGSHVYVGSSFVKRWTMKNTGNTTWTKGGNYLWTYDGSEQFGAATQTFLPDGVSVAPNATRAWDVPMTAPLVPGNYRGYWKMDRYGVHRFGDRVWLDIVVDDYPDADADGYKSNADCDDANAAIHPGAADDCNGIDDDCDGATDEDFVAVETTCGVGACAATGMTSCTAGVVLDLCTAGTPVPEVCGDGIDNDCDGVLEGMGDKMCDDGGAVQSSGCAAGPTSPYLALATLLIAALRRLRSRAG